MTDAILDALLVTLADVEAYGGKTFELDTSVKVLEGAAAILHDASQEERQLLILRARELAAQGGDPERIAFLENIGEGLGLDEDD
jgi:hypothetical protein